MVFSCELCYYRLREVFQLKQKYIPLEKRSKREQRGYHAARRGNWGDVNPVTRRAPNPKAHNRKKSGRWLEHEPQSGLLFV